MNTAYLEIKNPNIRSDPHQRLLELLSFSFGTTHPATIGTAPGSGASGGINPLNMSITRVMDTASAKLSQACSNGTRFDEVILTVYKDDSAATKPYVTYTMKLCLLESYNYSADSEPGYVTESLGFSFTTYKMETS